MQCRREKGIDYFVCGASGASYCSFYGGEDKDRQMDWWDPRVCGFVVVSVTRERMVVEFVSNEEKKGYPVVHVVTKEK
jgi:hypothetical protein